MTEEEFKLKERDWTKRAEDLLVEMQQFTNHRGLHARLPDISCVSKWFIDSFNIMKESFESDGAILIPLPGDYEE